MFVTGGGGENQPHILVFPYPAQGHMLALLDLAHLLALRNLAITVLVTPKNLPILTPLLSAHPTIETLVLPFPAHPGLPAGVENVRDIGNAGNVPIMNALAKLQDPIIQWFDSHPNPPAAIISDFFLGWTLHLARRIDVPRIAFFSVRALLASLFDRLWGSLRTPGGHPLLPVLDFPDLPRSPTFKYEHLPSLFLLCRGSDPEADFVGDCVLANSSSWGYIFNTFDALEGDCLSYLRKEVGHGRVYGVGPLSLVGVQESLDVDNLDCAGVAAWLDRCPDNSVLYVCFGSQKLLRRQQMEALAFGLEQSEVRFIWVVKPSTAEQEAEGSGIIPDGFEERIGSRGLVIRGWAPQVLILNHRAVGGFLSHCGWNSTLEGVVAGVRILGWPMEADQHVNARLLVEEMGVAVRVCEGADGVPEPAKLAKVIAEAMSGDAPEKTRAKELKERALTAVRGGGSSANDLDELVRELRGLPKLVAKIKSEGME